ncbi:1555_t:CDS:10 [Cetraspora pellucida]|uniref:1555_t:CDS:1 n=1 Tax=Cetraspora pellucida TaxID=1433469 RepID=A0A9N9GS07_9GLOM|nr:1555_t:CDS:10 [Cetraspora pellucida]
MRLVDEVPAIKVTYENQESIPAPSIINGCEVFRDNLNYDREGICSKYLISNLSLTEKVRKNVERIAQDDLSNYTGLIHNGDISLKEGDVIRLYLTIDSTILNSIILFDPEYLKYSDQPLYIDSLSLENIYFMSHNINSSLYNFNRFKRQLMDKTLFTQLGFSPSYQTYHYITTAPGFSQGASINAVTNMLVIIKPKTTTLQVEKEQKSRTVNVMILDILGTITALYGLMLSFYVFLFREASFCEIVRFDDVDGGYDSNKNSSEDCGKYLAYNLLLADNARKHFERIVQTELTDYTTFIHNGNITLKEGDYIHVNFTMSPTKINILTLFDTEYLTYSDEPLQLMDTTLLTQIGFAPNYRTYNYITTNQILPAPGPPNTTTMVTTIRPKSAVTQVEKEQKSRTVNVMILDILGTITALYSLMLSIYVFLFQRELSSQPYGLIRRFVVFGGPPEKPLIERLKNPLEKSLIERIEYLESQIGTKYENYKQYYHYV